MDALVKEEKVKEDVGRSKECVYVCALVLIELFRSTEEKWRRRRGVVPHEVSEEADFDVTLTNLHLRKLFR